MPNESYTLHLAHQSLQNSDPDKLTVKEIGWLLERAQPDIVSYTETYGIHKEMRAMARSHGYMPVFFPNNIGESFIYNPDRVKLKSKGNIVGSEAHPDGDYPKRYVNWGHWKLDDEDIWYHTAHWLARLAYGNGRVERHNTMSRQMAAQVRLHAQGSALSFFSGDSNSDDEGGNESNFNQIMRSNGLLTIWDEFQVYPGTMNPHGRTIDFVGSYSPDKRVKGLRYKLWPKQESDHRAVSAWYEIKRARVKNPSGEGGGGSGGNNGGGSPGPNPGDDDPFVTGGNRDFSDYFDGTIYDLPQAVDDSGDPRHGGLISD